LFDKKIKQPVIPVKTGIQNPKVSWIPACAEMTQGIGQFEYIIWENDLSKSTVQEQQIWL